MNLSHNIHPCHHCWDAACYVFPRQQAQEGVPTPRTMLKFEGIFNGRPLGKGVRFWEDGEEVGDGGCMQSSTYRCSQCT